MSDETVTTEETTETVDTKTNDKPKTFTQAEVDRIVSDRVGRERAKYADYEEIKASSQSAKEEHATELSSLKTQLEEQTAELSANASKAETEALRLRVALTKGLPAELIDRLRGESEEELSNDAEALIGLLTPAQRGGTGLDGGVRTTRQDVDIDSETDPKKVAQWFEQVTKR